MYSQREMSRKCNIPLQRASGVASSTASRSSFLVQTKMGPRKSAGTFWPLRIRMSSPVPMLCSICPILPPPIMMAGTIEVALLPSAAIDDNDTDAFGLNKKGLKVDLALEISQRERKDEMGTAQLVILLPVVGPFPPALHKTFHVYGRWFFSREWPDKGMKE